MKSLVVHSEARAELDHAIDYYEQQQAGVGARFEAEIDRVLEMVGHDPEIGSPYKETKFRYVVTRKFPYVIYYLNLQHFIWVSAIAHRSQRPDYWKRRRPE